MKLGLGISNPYVAAEGKEDGSRYEKKYCATRLLEPNPGRGQVRI